MQHVRRQIREAFKAVLGALPTTGSRVYTGRTFPLEEATEVPGLLITGAGSETGERSAVDSFGPAVKLARGLPIAVVGFAVGDAIEDQLDQIALEVEQAIAADWEASTGSRLKALCRDVALVGTALQVEPGNQVTGMVRLTFAVEYRTARGAPQTAAL